MQLNHHPPTPLEKTLAALPYLRAPYGPIESIAPQPVTADEPGYWHVHASVRVNIPGRPPTTACGGSSPNHDIALGKAIGESVERYSIVSHNPKNIRVARAVEIEEGVPWLDSLDLFTAEQRTSQGFPFAKLDPETPIGWVKAYSLTHQRPCHVPATLAHLYHQPHTLSDSFDLPPVSGYAAGASLEEALLGALCEVVERDALMISWYQRLMLPALDLASFASPTINDALTLFARAPVQLYCSALASDTGIPAVIVVATSDHPNWPAASIATAADLSAERAVIKALGELSSGHMLVAAYRGSGRSMPQSVAQVVDPADHGLFYAQRAHLPGLDLLLRPRATVTASDMTTDWSADDVLTNLNTCIAHLANRGLEAIAYDLTAPEVAAHGFHVVKVIVPGMQPIDFGHEWRHLGGARLHSAPLAAGFVPTATHGAAMNKWPHPLP
jgi:ribosomal protein S12 methylthiotransferase accessory factor